MYLLDTNVVSELRKKKPHGAVLSWLEKTPEESLYVSVVTIGEIQSGIELTREIDALKAREIEDWLEDVAHSFRVLAADTRVFRQWAKIVHRRPDHHLEDALIAATALVHEFTVVTRNVADFRIFEVPLLDPFARQPS